MILYTNDTNHKKIHINESQIDLLREDVFVNKINHKKANLTYNKRNSTNRIRNIGNYDSFDMLDTSKMDQNNADTFIVPLKGGINSYNITSIKGEKVMHYFKNKFSNKKTNIDIEVDGQKQEFELFMEDAEFQEFLNNFIAKVSNVVNYVSKQIATQDKNFQGFKGVSIYPVPSSSNFNQTMAQILARYNVTVSNLPCHYISTKIFDKELSNLEKDTEFINKNKEYYNGRYFKGGDDNRTHIDVLDDTIRKYNNQTSAQDETLINDYNYWINRTIQSYRTKTSPQRIAYNYDKIVQVKNEIRKRLNKSEWNLAFNSIRYAKGPSDERRTREIHDIVASVKGKTYISLNQIPMVEIEPQKFQIKKLSNDVRMGLRNYFQAKNGIEDEINRIKGTVFVIFDDNVSGGATLSDICYQAKKLGINYIIPITFGEMRVKYTQGIKPITKPTKWNF